MTASVAGVRQLPSWIEGCLKYSELDRSPEILRKWAAISALGASLERKVYTVTSSGNVYPNIYVLLVAPPGGGKGVALSRIEDIYSSLTTHHISPSSITAASLVDSMVDAKREISRLGMAPPYIKFHSLYVITPELGVLLPAYDPQIMNTFNDMYDCRETKFHQRRRTKNVDIKIEAPQVSLLGLCTPSFLNDLLPDAAWDQGFVSRTIMVFTPEIRKSPLFASLPQQRELRSQLISDLKVIGSTVGTMVWMPEAAKAIQEWDSGDCQPAPDHPKLAHYLTRRLLHVMKLTMISAADRGRMIIHEEDFIRAKGWLEEIEIALPDLFRYGGVSGDRQVMDECFHFVFKAYHSQNKPVLEQRILRFLSEKTPAYQVPKLLALLLAEGSLKQVLINGLIFYEPGSKTKEY